MSTAVHDVRLSRALSLIPIQVEIPREVPPTLPGEMSHPATFFTSSCFLLLLLLFLLLLPASSILARATVPFQRCLHPMPPPPPLLPRPSFVPLSSRRCPKPSIRFLASPFLPLAHTTSSHAALKLAFSLLSSEAADFPHFTFQSRGGCDFLPHFHSDNVGGSSRSRRAVAKSERRGDGSSRVSPAVAKQQKSGKRGWRKGSFANPSITC